MDAPEDSPCEADVGVGLQQVLVEHYSAVPASAVPVELVLPREVLQPISEFHRTQQDAWSRSQCYEAIS